MKKKVLCIVLFMLIVALAGCGSTQQDAAKQEAETEEVEAVQEEPVEVEEAGDPEKESMDVARNCDEVKTRLAGYKKWADDRNVRWMLQEYGCAA